MVRNNAYLTYLKLMDTPDDSAEYGPPISDTPSAYPEAPLKQACLPGFEEKSEEE